MSNTQADLLNQSAIACLRKAIRLIAAGNKQEADAYFSKAARYRSISRCCKCGAEPPFNPLPKSQTKTT